MTHRPGFYMISRNGAPMPPAVVTSPSEMAAIANAAGHYFYFAGMSPTFEEEAVTCKGRSGPLPLYPTSNWPLFMYYPPDDAAPESAPE